MLFIIYFYFIFYFILFIFYFIIYLNKNNLLVIRVPKDKRNSGIFEVISRSGTRVDHGGRYSRNF